MPMKCGVHWDCLPLTLLGRCGRVVFHATGNGHGVGMSQYGAKGMAQEGKNFKEILKHYYTGVELKSAY